MKMIKIVATRCQILRQKCTKFNFSCGSAPDTAGGAYSASPDPVAGFKWPTSKGKGGERWKWRERKATISYAHAQLAYLWTDGVVLSFSALP